MSKLAVIDFGSNTFHLLIVEVTGNNNNFHELERKRIFTNIAEGGVQEISTDAIQRGIDACLIFKDLIHSHHCDYVGIVGTEALRSAANSPKFVNQVELILSTKVEIIDGNREADLIFKGVKLLHPMDDGSTYLIMDIGGGSTEFIIVKNSNVLWAQSFKLGVAVMFAEWHHTEPISHDSLSGLQESIEIMLEPLFNEVSLHKPDTLIGASGSFEVLESMTGKQVYYHQNNTINISEFERISEIIINSSYEERLTMEGLPKERAKLIVVAMVLLQKIVYTINPKNIIVTPYALKEGVLSEMMDQINKGHQFDGLH